MDQLAAHAQSRAGDPTLDLPQPSFQSYLRLGAQQHRRWRAYAIDNLANQIEQRHLRLRHPPKSEDQKMRDHLSKVKVAPRYRQIAHRHR